MKKNHGCNFLMAYAFFVVLTVQNVGFTQQPPAASQIQRGQELIDQEKELREKIQEERIFIETIVVKGVTVLPELRVKDITAPYEERWITKSDIQRIISKIKKAYKQKGRPERSIKISYDIIDKDLEITVVELTYWNI